MNIKKILITQSQLKNYSGSEIVTLELAEHFSTQGVQVSILTQYYDYPIKQDFEKVGGVNVLITGSAASEALNIEDYDLVWVHHLTLTAKLAEQLADSARGKPYVVFNHMSSVDMLEFPLLPTTESEAADLVLFNSEETVKSLALKGARFKKSKTHIFANPAPDAYSTIVLNNKKSNIPSILVISNHPPRELIEAAALLRRRSFVVDFIGRSERGKVERVTPEILSKYDIVVSIGKTVQYCLTANIPIFCYDRFGGPGYLTKRNYNEARIRNFSGRGFSRMSKDDLVVEFTRPVEEIKFEFNELHELYGKDFLLSSSLKKVFVALKSLNKEKRIVSKQSKFALIYHSAKMNKYFPAYLMYVNELKDLRKDYEELLLEKKNISEKLTSLKLINQITDQAKQYTRTTKLILRHPRQAAKKASRVLAPLSSEIIEKNRKRALKYLGSNASILHITDKNLKKLDYEQLVSELTNLNNTKIDWDSLGKKHSQTKKGKLMVSIVMLVYKNIDMTMRAIEAVMNVKTNITFELIVVDNGSDATTLKGLKSIKLKYPLIKLIYIDQNLNFSLGNNVGFMYAEGSISVFLNNDTEVTNYWLEGITDPFTDKSVKVVQPALLYPDNTIQSIGIVFSKKSDIGYGLYAGSDSRDMVKMKDRRLQAVTGACMALRSKDFTSLKGFDPAYINGQEDIDLCLRLSKYGPNPAFCTVASTVYHFEGKSQGRGKRVILNRKQLLNRWSGKIVPDDEPIYQDDGFIVGSWNLDSTQSLESGVEVYTPNLKRVTIK